MSGPRTKWDPREGMLRACGKGPIGVHQGKPVWALEAAQDRREALLEQCTETWIERYADGQWKRV